MCVLVSRDFVNEAKSINKYVFHKLSIICCLGIIIQFSVGVVMQAIQVRNETNTLRLACVQLYFILYNYTTEEYYIIQILVYIFMIHVERLNEIFTNNFQYDITIGHKY